MSIKKLSFMLLSAFSLAALLNGCGSSSKKGSPGDTAKVASEGICITCHSTTLDHNSGTSIVADYATSSHNPINKNHDGLTGCEGCHGGGSQHNGVGPFPYRNPLDAADGFNSRCRGCHVPAYSPIAGDDLSALFAVAKTEGFTAACANCHSASGKGSIHAAGSSATKGCVDCHAVAGPQHGASLVGDNNGVRAVTGDFSKTSHHVSGRSVTNSDCAVCHLEGKNNNGAIVVDPTYHMKDNKIYLRNGNTALVGNQDHSTSATGAAWVSGAGLVAYAWNPAVPDHTVMDQFCFSCHNAAGAPSAFQALNGAVQADSARTRTSLNPFGDSVSNAYDQVSRISVVGVYEQFATTNSSHHAVRGAKYATKNLTAAQFTNISTVNYKFVNAGVAAPITGTKSSDTVVGSLQKIAGTMYETGKFTNYYTIGTTTPMADNSVLHCGDCHTVGQFRAADVGVAPFNNQVIGAHGSNNEYMLRNSKGTDTFTKDALVCFICHKEQYYNSDASSATAVEGYSGAPIIGGIKHAGVNSGWDCNGNILNSAGKTGMARLQLAEDEDGDDDTVAANILKITTGKYTATSGSPIFGYSCAGCHNASDKKTFGGIHGNAGNASFTTYSGGKSTNVFDATTAVSRKPYRFLPGLGNFRFNGGDNPDQWMVRTLSTSNKQGCYTLNGASASSGSSVGKANSRTSAVLSGANVSSTAIANDNGILGSWGACTDHSGSSYAGGRAVTRTILRPLTY